MWEYHIRHKETGEELDIWDYSFDDACRRTYKCLPQELNPDGWEIISYEYED